MSIDIFKRFKISSTYLIILSTILALIFANSFFNEIYFGFIDYKIYYVDLSIKEFISDFLLVIFFFVIGLELKYEFLVTNNKNINSIFIPLVAAIFGVIFPAIIYLAINTIFELGSLDGWAIPTATDITFAVAILLILKPNISKTLKTFLLTLAVVDDLIAILIILFKFSENNNFYYLAVSLIPGIMFYYSSKLYKLSFLLMFTAGILFIILIYKSGIHPTIGGVILGLLIPIQTKNIKHASLNRFLYKNLEKISSFFVIPIFAFVASGIYFGGFHGIFESFKSPILWGVILGLTMGKFIGIGFFSLFIKKISKNPYFNSESSSDILGIAAIAGIGFTVSILTTDLTFENELSNQAAKTGVILSCFFSIFISSAFLNLNIKKNTVE